MIPNKFVYLTHSITFKEINNFFLVVIIIESWLNYNQKPINFCLYQLEN